MERGTADRSVDDRADGWGYGVADRHDVEALREAGDHQGELHLRESETDAHVMSASEWDPCSIGDDLLLVREGEMSVGIEALGIRPCVGIATGEVWRPGDQRPLLDAVLAEA